jgi:hypothetical protein
VAREKVRKEEPLNVQRQVGAVRRQRKRRALEDVVKVEAAESLGELCVGHGDSR